MEERSPSSGLLWSWDTAAVPGVVEAPLAADAALPQEAGSGHLDPCRDEAVLQSPDEHRNLDAGPQNLGVHLLLEVRQAAGEWGAWDGVQGHPVAAWVYILDHRHWDHHQGVHGRKLGVHAGWLHLGAEERAQPAAVAAVEAEAVAPNKPVLDQSVA